MKSNIQQKLFHVRKKVIFKCSMQQLNFALLQNKQSNTKHKPQTDHFLEHYVFQVTNTCHESLYIQSSSSSLVIATHFKLSAQDHHCFKMLLKGSCFAREEYEIDLYEAIDELNNVEIGNIILSQEKLNIYFSHYSANKTFSKYFYLFSAHSSWLHVNTEENCRYSWH